MQSLHRPVNLYGTINTIDMAGHELSAKGYRLFGIATVLGEMPTTAQLGRRCAPP